MGNTTLSVDEETKERLEDHRAPGHHSWDEALHGMMELLPAVDEIQEGCGECGQGGLLGGVPEDGGGVIRYFSTVQDGTDIHDANYYCSNECLGEVVERMDHYVPEEPDVVIVGGGGELRAEFGDATFYIDGDTMEVGLPVPGAFDGEDSHGNQYAYYGEPVYVVHDGEVVQKGVIEDIIHEETHTALILEHDHSTTMLHHPNDDKREQYEDNHVEWFDFECPDCGGALRSYEGAENVECPECDTTIDDPEAFWTNG
jgi:ribosomal protein S27E